MLEVRREGRSSTLSMTRPKVMLKDHAKSRVIWHTS